MTELVNANKCRDCYSYGDPTCGNSNSDHYGHMLAPWHQACSVFQKLEDLHHVNCASNTGGDCDCSN